MCARFGALAQACNAVAMAEGEVATQSGRRAAWARLHARIAVLVSNSGQNLRLRAVTAPLLRGWSTCEICASWLALYAEAPLIPPP